MVTNKTRSQIYIWYPKSGSVTALGFPWRMTHVSATSRLIAFGSDHAGYSLKSALVAEATTQGFEIVDLGTYGRDSVDYPDFGYAVAEAVASGRAWRGVVICGSGIGISIAANRHPGARAALCSHGLMARLARQHNDANILALGERLTGVDVAKDALREFLTTEFEGGRHAARVIKLSKPMETAQ
jgi:ribose 5-phosphate isomerase B